MPLGYGSLSPSLGGSTGRSFSSESRRLSILCDEAGLEILTLSRACLAEGN